jgi:hypothetical protein
MIEPIVGGGKGIFRTDGTVRRFELVSTVLRVRAWRPGQEGPLHDRDRMEWSDENVRGVTHGPGSGHRRAGSRRRLAIATESRQGTVDLAGANLHLCLPDPPCRALKSSCMSGCVTAICLGLVRSSAVLEMESTSFRLKLDSSGSMHLLPRRENGAPCVGPSRGRSARRARVRHESPDRGRGGTALPAVPRSWREDS